MSIRKSSIQEAIIEAKEIENSALEKAKKALEEELAPKIKQVANEALRQLEQETLSENMSIEIPANAELTIKMPNGEATAVDVDKDDVSSDIENNDSIDNLEDVEEMPNDEITNNEDDMEDIFEIEDMNEEEVQPAAPAAPAPAAAPQDATPELDAPPVDAAPEEASLETVNQKLDDILSKIEGISTTDSMGSEGDTEGQVDIVDDEVAPAENPAPAPAPAAPVAPDLEGGLQEVEYELEDDGSTDEEVVYEMEDEEAMSDSDVVYEMEEETDEIDSNSIMEMFNELQQLDELEIVDENEDESDNEEIEEDSHATRHRTSQRKKIGKLPMSQEAPRSDASLKESIEKIKTQYGSKFDELTKENESLKQTIKEYKESFVVLRKQINEVQIFNAKLAYANKLFANGGLTNDEKAKIAEEFDKVETIEEAKKIYNNLLSEMKVSKSPKSNPAEKLRSANPAVIKSSDSTSQTLFESDEMRRMKKLAGI